MNEQARWTVVVGLLVVLAVGCPGGGSADGGVPEEVVRLNNLGTSYLSQQKWSEALEQFDAALSRRAGDPILLNNRAVALLQQGKADEAEASLRDALAGDAEHPYANYNLGLVEKNRGNFEQARGHFETVRAHDDTDVFTLYNLGTSLDRLGRAEDAREVLRAALERNPTHVSTLYALGRHLLQQGDADEGTRLITLSQEIRARSGLDEAVGNQYGEQGPYALGADYPAGGLAAPAPVDVRFSAAPFSGALEGRGPPPAWALLPGGDGAQLISGYRGLVRLGAAAGDLAPPLADDARLLDLEPGDLDGDGTLELVAAVLTGDPGRLTLQRLDEGSDGWAWSGELAADPQTYRLAANADLALVDKDHDGDLDLYWCSAQLIRETVGAVALDEASRRYACRIATGDGAGSFTLDETHGITVPQGGGPRISVGFSDADNDRDVDLLVATEDGVRLYSNERDGRFTDVTEKAGLAGSAGARSLQAVDLDKDGWMDLLTADAGGPRVWWNRRGTFRPGDPLPGGDPSAEGGSADVRALAFDHDNDGFLDIAFGAPGRLALQRNLGAGGWAEPVAVGDAAGAPLAAADADGDGDLDLLLGDANGYGFAVNDGGNANGWLRVELAGVGDNKSGIGTKVDVLAGALRQKFEITTALPLHVGLGGRDTADAVRLLWPGGVLQDELDQPARQAAQIAQLDRKGTSCPLLYAWRGGRWQFETDFLGGCAIGYNHGNGKFSTPDTDEYVKIEGGLEARDGELHVRLNNQLEEVIWFDRAELVAVDHPAGSEVQPNERLMPGPPWPQFELYASSDVRPVVVARELESGRDVTERLARRDRATVDGFRLLRFKGYAEPHTLELDFGALPEDTRTVLLLDGWIDYADSTANVGAVQAGLALSPPRLYAADATVDGGWRELRGLMGFPAGLPKTMAVDLSGRLTPGDARVRIATNMRIYWDRARIMVGGADTPLTVRRLSASRAELAVGGFPRPVSPDGAKPHAYDPLDVSDTAMWKAHAGAYTALGDVRELLGAIDDRFVTTRNGDEITLAFPAPPPPAPGMTRSYLLYADGFGKDMDPNSAAADRVGPIPFHGMPRYPYGPEVTPPHPPEERARVVSAAADGVHAATPLPLLRRD